jgi:hypothetical protein
LGKEHFVKKSRFTEDQMAFALTQAELGIRVEEICRKLKQIVAELSLDKAMLQAVVAKKLGSLRSAVHCCWSCSSDSDAASARRCTS